MLVDMLVIVAYIFKVETVAVICFNVVYKSNCNYVIIRFKIS